MFACQYEFKSKPIGEGSYGVVNIVERRGKQYVLKRLVSKKDEESIFHNPVELDILFRLNSPHLLKGYDITVSGECDPKDVGLVTNYVDGNILKDVKKLKFNQKKKLMFDIAKGLKCLHDNQFLHLDIKLDNALYTTSNTNGVLIDYGMVAFCPEGVEKGVELKAGWGTILYNSPKIAKNITKEMVRYTNKDDIWALGLAFCEFFATLDDIFFDLEQLEDSEEDYKKLFKYFKYYMSKKNIDDYLDDIIFYKQKVPDTLKDLIKGMLILEEDKRLDINAVIEHPFFSDLNKATFCYVDDPEYINLSGLDKKTFEKVYEIIDVAKLYIPDRNPQIIFMAIDIYLRFMAKAPAEVVAEIANPHIVALLIANKYFSWGIVSQTFDDKIFALIKEENLIYKIINGHIRAERYYSNCKYVEDVVNVYDTFIKRVNGSYNPNLAKFLAQNGKEFVKDGRTGSTLTPIVNLTIGDIF
jgi:serine/threonine protein kinase